MIRGYASLCPEDLDETEHAFETARMALIEREADSYPSLRTDRTFDVETHYLNVSWQPAPEDADEEDLAHFIMALEDRNLGYLKWEVDTDQELRLLHSINVANMSAVKLDPEPF